MRIAALVGIVALVASGCGTDDNAAEPSAATATTSATAPDDGDRATDTATVITVHDNTGSDGDEDTDDATTPSDPLLEPSPNAVPGLVDSTRPPASPSSPRASNPGDFDLDPDSALVRGAVADLAERLTVDPSDVIVVMARAVTWGDSSLGCPQPGMSYLPAVIDGSLVILDVDGTHYEYHGGTPLTLCEHPAPPVGG